MPLAVIHEVAVLPGLLVGKQAHGGTAPDLTDPPPCVPVQHEGGGVEALDGANIAGPGVEGILPVRGQGGGGSHGEGELTVFAVVDEADFRAVVTIGVVAPPGVAEEMPERSVEHVVRHLGTAFPGQHEEGDDVGAGRVEVTASIGGEGTAPAGPGIVVL